MIARVALIVVNEGIWLPIAMTAALLVVAASILPHRHDLLPRTRLVMAAMNLFVGVTLAIMGVGHLLAVTTKQVQGTLEGSALLLYPIGIAIVVPAWLMIHHTRTLLATDTSTARATTRLNLWMAVTLVILGLINLPLAVPALLNAAYSRHTRPATGWILVTLNVLVLSVLFVGGVLFMASGARTFEEFQGMQ